jgi:hypothetical protein
MGSENEVNWGICNVIHNEESCTLYTSANIAKEVKNAVYWNTIRTYFLSMDISEEHISCLQTERL